MRDEVRCRVVLRFKNFAASPIEFFSGDSEYTQLLRPALGFAVNAEKVLAVAAEAVQIDPVENTY